MIALGLLLILSMQDPAAPLTVEAIRIGPARMIAERLIPVEQAANVERAEVERDRMLPGRVALRLMHRLRPIADDMCAQRVHHVDLLTEGMAANVPRDRQPLRVTHIYESETIALAPDCRTAPDHSFAHINPSVPRSDAMTMLRRFAAVQAAARGASPLPFRLICRDEFDADPNVCGLGARRALAAIRPDRIWLITRGDEDEDLRLVIGNRGGLHWDVRIRNLGTDRTEVRIIWKEPAPF